MKTKEIIKIWKEIIYISGFYKNYSENDKIKIEKKLLSYKEKISWSENLYSKKLNIFLDDLILDLKNNRKLQIDNIFEDDFVWNYYESYNQNKIYNSLILKEKYLEILENKSDNNLLLNEIYSNYSENIKKLNSNIISKNLLIFTIFELNSPKKYLKRLFFLKNNLKLDFDSIKKLQKMMISYENFIEKIHKNSLIYLKNKNFSYKYIKISKIWEEKDFELNFSLKDASKYDFRSWKPLFEYKEILKNLEK